MPSADSHICLLCLLCRQRHLAVKVQSVCHSMPLWNTVRRPCSRVVWLTLWMQLLTSTCNVYVCRLFNLTTVNCFKSLLESIAILEQSLASPAAAFWNESRTSLLYRNHVTLAGGELFIPCISTNVTHNSSQAQRLHGHNQNKGNGNHCYLYPMYTRVPSM